MTSFATLHGSVRRALAKRELRRRGAAPRADEERVDAAIRDLHAALAALLPSSPGVEEQVAAMAVRVGNGTTTSADLAVLTSLPPDALGVLGVTPAGYITLLQDVFESC